MSEYIHEIVLQDYIVENIAHLNMFVQFGHLSRMKLIEASPNNTGTFWDLLGKLENGNWIPIEVEWTTNNFISHKHDKNANFNKFKKENGILLVLRKTKELPNIQQISIFDSLTESQFKKEFKIWFKKKSTEYVDRTLKKYMVGAYKRELPRIILYPLTRDARKNYFPNDIFYQKNNTGPSLIGFTPKGYQKNVFIRDLQPNDVILFVSLNGTRCKRDVFISKIKKGKININKLVGYKIKSKVIDKCLDNTGIDLEYWPDEIKKSEMIYQYVCAIEDEPFITKNNEMFPFINTFSENTWEAFRSCVQFGEYHEISPLDFTSFISNL